MEMSITLAVTLILMSSVITLIAMTTKSTARNTEDAEFANDIDSARSWISLWYDRYFSYDTGKEVYELSLNEKSEATDGDIYERNAVTATCVSDATKSFRIVFDAENCILNVYLYDKVNSVVVELKKIKDVRFYLYTIDGKNTVLRTELYFSDVAERDYKSPVAFTLIPYSDEKAVIGKGVYSR